MQEHEFNIIPDDKQIKLRIAQPMLKSEFMSNSADKITDICRHLTHGFNCMYASKARATAISCVKFILV